jgi:hypothetical protein
MSQVMKKAYPSGNVPADGAPVSYVYNLTQKSMWIVGQGPAGKQFPDDC